MNSKKKNTRDMYRGLNEFKKGYQRRRKLVKDENGDMLADSHNILIRLKHCYRLLNVNKFSVVRQIEMHIAEPLVPDPSPSEVETAIAKFKRYKSPGSHNIPAELIQAGGEILRSEIHNSLTLFEIRKNCLISGRSLLLYRFTRRVIKLTAVIIVEYHGYQLLTKFYPIAALKVTSIYHSLTHGAEPFLGSCQLSSHSRNSQHFMETKDSLRCSQEPSTGPYPGPGQSNPYHPILSL
jgi:hypothetical protein